MANQDPFADFKLDGYVFVNPQEEEYKAAVAITEEAIAKRNEEFTERMASVTRDLQGASNAKSVPLSIFELFFYPMFAGDLKEEEHKKRLHAWTMHAGGSYAEVPVVHDDTGEELFRVPGLITSDILNDKALQLREEGVPPLGVTQNHLTALRSAGRLSEADEIEEGELLKRVPEKKEVIPHAVFNAMRWNNISAALGKPPIYPKLAAMVAKLDGAAKEAVEEVVKETVVSTATTQQSRSVFDDLF